ncbi:hypothetical protein [Methylocystis rosea]|uniref:HEPN domain-containing protein n=1 Tax=Methylocystis rosea TaxID=173366 RepID=A0A3G8M696_9HYPH|nr:hypothetical protein [Methylocystis rosea]AZG76702.1 hypothetical protein EHO51_08180 [Methylocystis rosea]
MSNFRAKASSSTRLVAGIDPTTVDGLSRAFRIGACECLTGAHMLDKDFDNSTGGYILTFHAIELGLKAFLLKQGHSLESLRKKPFGHDLVELFDAAKKSGLTLNFEHADEMISWVNEWHSTVMIRYEFTQHRELPICAELFTLAHEILDWSK